MQQVTQRHLNAPILIVDDLELNRLMLSSTLQTAGFTSIHTAENGLDALAVMERTPISLVILDLIMPKMDGFTFCKTVRERWPDVALPILVQTAMAEANERLNIFSVGASDLLIKPVNPKELLLRIGMHLGYAFSLRDLAEYRTRISAELYTAQRTQRALMPNQHITEQIQDGYGVLLSSYYQPSSEIGGDLWNIIPIDETRLAIYALDVSGHGMTAAIHAFQLHSVIHHSNLPYGSPADTLKHLNQYARHIFNPGEFAVCLFATIDLDTGHMEYASAGFTAPIHYNSATGTVQILENSGVPLGITDAFVYETRHTTFKASDSLIIYSDALIETPGLQTGAFLSEEAISGLLQQHASNTPNVKIRHELVIPALLDALAQPNITDDLMIVMTSRQH